MQVTIKKISQLLDVPTIDPDDARRGKLLNILLLGMFVLGLASLLLISVFHLIGQRVASPYLEDTVPLFSVTFGLLIGIAVIYAVNRYWISWIAGSLFVLLLVTASFAGDEIAQVIRGRSLVLFTIPIVMSSVLIRPYASFVTAGIVAATFFVVGVSIQIMPDPFAIIIFMSIALASWLSARTMEYALKDLQILNAELDMRVIERTRQLTERTDQLAEALAKTEAILESTADGIVVFDRENQAAIANPATAALLGCPMEQIVGQDIHTLISDHVSDDADQKAIIDLVKGGTRQEINVKTKWDNKTLSVTAAPVHLESGDEIGTVAIFHDYTLEAQIDRMKSTFVSIASHELRTPLSAILGYTEMLQAGIGGPLAEEQHDMIGRILASTGQMLSLARNFLDQAQMEEGKLTLALTAFSPGELIDNVSAMMEVIAQGKGLQLTSHVADDLPKILTGNPERLQQILVNLTSNAIKFTKAGSVTLKAYLPDADHWVLEVSDTGRGIPQEAQEYIFDPFQKVADDSEDGSTEKYSGAGLGLSIVRQLVELMDGEIMLKSQIGHGSTFTIVLPLTMSEVLTSR